MTDRQTDYVEGEIACGRAIPPRKLPVFVCTTQVREQADELAWLRSNGNASSAPSSASLDELLNRLRTEHEALLLRQLDDMRQHCLRDTMNCSADCSTAQSQQCLLTSSQGHTMNCTQDNAVQSQSQSQLCLASQCDTMNSSTVDNNHAQSEQCLVSQQRTGSHCELMY